MKKIVLLSVAFNICTLVMGQEPKIVPPSPETAALFRYQEYPMDHSTGLPQISIPLFEVKNGSLSVPISISYHASGRKVSDRDGPIAVGWSLNIGGMVSRTIKDDPDFGIYPFPCPFETDEINLTPIQRMMNYLGGQSNSGNWTDSEYDIFSYSFGNKSGKFLFKDSCSVKTPVLLPFKPIDITPISNQGSPRLESIEIKDDNGDTYIFNGVQGPNSERWTGYRLSQIISADLKNTIDYSYTTTTQDRKSISQKVVINDLWLPGSSGSSTQVATEQSNLESYSISRINEIDFKKGKLEFVVRGGTSEDKDLIDYIYLKNKNNDTIKIVKFLREPLNAVDFNIGTTTIVNTHLLSGIEIQNKDGESEEKYSFEHYPTIYSGIQDGNGTINPRYIDFWGYYNASGIVNMVPRQTVENIKTFTNTQPGTDNVGPLGYTNKKPNLEAMKSGVIKKIIFPTGGSAEFFYGNNKFKNEQTSQIENGPGLRVDSIVSHDARGNSTKRMFKYGTTIDLESGFGILELQPRVDLYMNTLLGHQYFGGSVESTHRERTYHSSFVPSLSEISSRPIIYTAVSEYIGDTSNNIGKITYEYDHYPWDVAPNGYPDQYETMRWHIPSYKYWDAPKLRLKVEHKFENDGQSISYVPKRSMGYGYSVSTNQLNDVKGIHVQRQWVFPQDGFLLWGAASLPTEEFGTTYNGGERNIYAVREYSIATGTKNLISTSETIFNDDGSQFETNTSYTYNSRNLVSEVLTKTSKIDGVTLENIETKKEITYPFDYTGDATLLAMENLNMLQSKVEEKNYLDNTLLSSSKVNYKDWGNTNFLPEIIQSSKGSNSLEDKLVYHSYYDNGNVQEVSRKDGTHIVYIWGYNEQYPVAKLEGAEYADLYPSMYNDIIAKSNADNSVANENLLREALNKLRDPIESGVKIAKAMITTYTYDPLIGVTSITDPRGQTIYYHYDEFNRLKFVKDSDGNVLSKNEYNYKN